MEIILKLLLLAAIVLKCNAVSYLEQLRHIMSTRRENRGISIFPSRRFDVNQAQSSVILGAPNMPSHLPEGEAILPGHTLIRPALGMLKSAVKFPHKVLENGAGVYGNIENLGIRYDGKNERVLYSGFRRMPQDYVFIIPSRSPKNYEDHKARPSKSFITNLLSKLINDSLRRNKTKSTVIQLLDNDSDYSEDKLIESQEKTDQGQNNNEEKPKDTKQKLFWETKDAYNHIKISPEAPDMSDFLPEAAVKTLQDWWFYNQQDYIPFEE
ncbi:hypothetical protein K1T71_003494 [Dendrolimus kikuchii]|uniref:Uncharacterized protein n=1 Tax=Dendrolimus kikuchii TaxID=765133 RepID=A0ACC1DBT4_9NEOP|nr:hypothetical protein K1T71_003494 [Dendrolimus kikuchii]